MITVIPIVGIAVGGFVICMHLLLAHKEKMRMIENNFQFTTPVDLELLSLFTGLVLTGVGLSLSLFFLIKSGIDYALLSGLIPLSTGISLIVFYMFCPGRKKKNGE